MNTMIIKVLKDLVSNKTKTLLMLLSLLVGTIAVGIVVMFSQFFIPEVNKSFQAANPNDILIKTSGFQENILKDVENINGVEYADARSQGLVRFVLNDKKINANLIVLGTTNSVNIITKSNGEPIPELNEGEIFIERAVLTDIDKTKGDSVKIETSTNQEKTLYVKEIVYDAVTEPYTLEGDIVAFVNMDTLTSLTGSNQYTDILIIVNGDKSKENCSEVTKKVVKLLEEKGITVEEIETREPGVFYATQALEAIKIIIIIIGSLCILLGVALIINIYSSLMIQHMKQIGIMKSIGANQKQIVGMYLTMVLILGFITLLISLPVSALIGYKVCTILAGLMNLELTKIHIPPLFVIAQMFGAIIIPLLAAFIPIQKGVKATIYDMLNNNLSFTSFKRNPLSTALSKAKNIHLLFLISVRNNFRNKVRVILTLLVLTFSGTILTTGINLQKSFSNEIEEAKFLIPDGILTLNEYQNAKQMEEIANNVEGVDVIEAWGFYSGRFIEPESGNTKKIRLMAPKPDSVLFDQKKATSMLSAGRLITDTSKNEIVISSHITDLYPNIQVGDLVQIKINQQIVEFEVVGIIELFGRPSDPIVYVGFEYLNSLLGGKDMVVDLRGTTVNHTEEYQNKVFSNIEKELNNQGIYVSEINLGASMLEQFTTSTQITILLLMFLSVMIGIVGAIGLSGTISINVIERAREFGIMRALGGTNKKINGIIILESIILSSVAWLLSLIFSIPLTILAGAILGKILIGTAAAFKMNTLGLFIWFCITLVVALIASIMPCIKINKMTTREILTFE